MSVADLTGKKPKDTYDSILHLIDNEPLTGAFKTVCDGVGNQTSLELATTEVRITNATINGTVVLENALGLAYGGTGASLSDPGGDRVLFWDDSAGTTTWLTIGTNLSITGTTLEATLSAATDHGTLTGLADDDHTQYLNTTRADTWLATKTTANLTEGSNLYYTNTRADDRIAAAVGVSVQAYDAELAAIAGTTSAADKAIYYTGVGTASTYTVTSTARDLLDDASASAMRTTLGLAIGTDVQAQNANLQSLAGITGAADKSVYFTGAGSLAAFDLSSYARTLLDDANAAAMQSTLGLGTLATQSGTFSGTSSGTNTGDQNVFTTIAVSGQSNVVSDTSSDTLTLVAGTNITITTDASTDSITINSSGGGGAGLVDADYGDITVSGTGTVMTIDNNVVTTAKILDANVTLAKLDNIATDSLIGRDTAGTGVPESITLGTGIEFTGSGTIQRSALTGDVTASAGSNSTTIANDAVTYAKMQNVSATDKLLGRSTSGAGDVEEITCTAFARTILDDVDAAATISTLGLGTLATQSGTFSGTSSGTNTGDQNVFTTIAVSGQSDVVSDATSDTLTLVAGTNITITTNAGTDTITINSTGGGGGGGTVNLGLTSLVAQGLFSP